MKAEIASYEKQGFYFLKQYDDVAVLKLGKNFLPNAINLAVENPLTRRITKNNEIISAK